MINYLLQLPSVWGLFLISVVLALVINVAYKYLTDQKLMKEIKDGMSEKQKGIKGLGSQPDKVMELNKEIMDLNAKYMMHSLKPTLITMLPLLLIIGWVGAHYDYLPVMPDKEFTVTVKFGENATGNVTLESQQGINVLSANPVEIADGAANFTLTGGAGDYLLSFIHGSRAYTKRVLITAAQEYEQPATQVTGNAVKEIKINNQPNKPLKGIFGLKDIFGWQPGWLGTYIIFSLVASLAIRKVMRLY